MTRKISLFIAVAATVAAALVTAAYGGTTSRSGPPAKPTRVAVAKSPLGRILIDSKGRTLYLFERDKGRASTCYGACAVAWPPYLVRIKPTAGPGVLARKLGTTKRRDGRLEVTYNGHPLYYYVGDSRRGDLNGQGLDDAGGKWYVLAPSGKKIDTD